MGFSMGRVLLLHLAMACCLASSAAAAASPHAFSEKDRAAAAQLLIDSEDNISSLEEKYQVLRSFQVLGIKREEPTTCSRIAEVLTSSSSSLREAFYAAKIGEALLCPLAEADIKITVSNLLPSLSSSDALLDLHFASGTLAIMKNWIKDDLVLENAVDIFNTIKALGQEDGTWKYSMNEDGSSAKAAGAAMETLASLISIAGPAIDESMIGSIKSAARKLFESIEKYDDGAQFFGEKSVDVLSGADGPLAATSYVVKGITAFAAVVPGRFEISAKKIVGIANFFLSAGIPGSRADMFHVLDALGVLEANSFAVPLVLSVYPSVLSLTAKDTLEVSITTVLGSPVPAGVTLSKATKASEKKSFLTNQVLESDANNIIHRLDLVNSKVDFGTYDLTFEVKPIEEDRYAVGGLSSRPVVVTGVASIVDVEVGVLDSDTGSPDFMKRWDPSTNEMVSLFATHLQKLHFSLDVLSPLKEPFKPHQVFVKLKHERKAEHLFLLKPNGKHLELSLDLLGLVEKLNYLSGVYTIELIVGDVSMENSVMWNLGTVELDLPEPPEGIAKSNSNADVPSKYGPKPEITHMFRPADKRAPPTLSNAFLILTLVPLLGFLIGLKLLNTNAKSFPTSGLPMVAALAFHAGIASILGLYILFWLKLNLFETLKLLGILGTFITVPGYYLLSHLADSSPKIKTA